MTEARQLTGSRRALLDRILSGEAAISTAIRPRRPDRVRLELTPAQRRVWFHARLAPDSAEYNIALGLRLRGRLDRPAFRAALAEMIARHEILRTRFASEDGEPVQVVDAATAADVEFHDLRGRPAAGRSAAALARRAAARPFDLAAAPLIRLLLMRTGPGEHVAVFVVHHIAFDGWSAAVFAREFSACYDALAAGDAPALDRPALQYVDYALWDRDRDRRRGDDADLDYWRRQLKDLPVLEPPTDHPRPARRSGRGAAVHFTIPAALAGRLRELCGRHETGPFTGLLAAYQSLLSRYSGQHDIPVGTLVAGRGRPELENMIGLLVNTVALRGDLSGDPSFAELLDRTRATTLAALAHQDVPFERLVEEFRPDRDLSRTPVFQALFEFYEEPPGGWAMRGLRAEPWAVDNGTEKFDLTLTIKTAGNAAAEDGEALAAKLSYSTDLFERRTAEQIVGHYLNLLRGALADPERPVSELRILSDAERRRILDGFNATAADLGTGRCLHELIEDQAARTPDNVAIAHGADRMTYRQLDEAANQVAHALRRRGAGPETVIGVCLTHHPQMLVALLGILKSGSGYLPLDPDHPSKRLAFMLEDTRAPLVVTREGLLESLPEGVAEVFCLDRDRDQIAAQPTTPPRSGVGPDNLVYVIYTSGSTGRPKGVMITHRGLNNYLIWAIDGYGLGGAQGAPMLGSIAFDLSIPNLFLPLLGGKDVTMLSPDRPLEHLAELLQDPGHDYSLIKITPSHLDALHALLPREARITCVRTYVVGADEVKTETVAAWRRVAPAGRIIDEYGPTETVVGCSIYHIPPDQDDSRPVPIGVPIANTRMYVLDRHLEPVPVGVVGELYIGGDGVARGYLGRPDLTAGKFLPDPYAPTPGARFYRTGDLARYLPDGNLEFLGRIDNQVKIRAHRIELGEIEARLLTHPGVNEAVVAARDDVPGASPANRQLVAYTTGDPEPPPAAELREHLAAALPSYMVPAHYVALPTLPLSPGGKVDRRLLPAPSRADRRRDHRPPRTPAEARLCDIIATVLDLDRVGVDDGFFDLGGHSLLALKLISRIRDAFGVELPLPTLFSGPTAAQLAREIEHGAPAVVPAIVSRPRDAGGIPLSFAQRRMWLLQQLNSNDTVYNTANGLLLDGPLDLPALRAALAEIVARHETLRTTYRAAGGQVTQVVAEPFEPALDRTDLADRPRDRAAAELGRLATRFVERPFDLSAAPPLRAHLFKLSADRHVLVLVIHHIVFDRPSWTVLLRDLSALYAAFRRGEGSPLEPLPVQYADYALWQHATLGNEVLDRQLEYWRARLRGLEPLRLPTDRPRPPVRSRHGGTCPFEIAPPLAEAVEDLARRHGATPFMCLLAAFQVLLARHSGQRDVAVGTPTAERSRPEIQDLIGFFSNTLVLRGDLSGDPTFAEFLGRVREATLGALANQDVPFERLVEEFKPNRDVSRTPIFQALFVLYQDEQRSWRAGDLGIDDYEIDREVTNYELTMSLVPRDGRICGTLNFSADLFDRETVQAMVDHYLDLLRRVVADPGTNVTGPSPADPLFHPPAAPVAGAAGPAGPAGSSDHRPGPAYESPRNPTEAALCEAVATVLGLDRVGIHDNFFQLGADSMAIIFAARHARDGGLHVEPTDFYENQSVVTLTRAIADRDGAASYLTAQPGSYTSLVRLKPEGARRPLFCVHPSGGSVAWYLPLCDAVAAEQPVLALQPAGMIPGRRPHGSIEQMAACYVSEMRAWQPEGPYAVLGWSLGGTIAYEIARQLRERGQSADPVLLLEPALPADERQHERDRHQIVLYRRGADLLGRDRTAEVEAELARWLDEMDWPRAAARPGTEPALRAAEAMLVAYGRYERRPHPGGLHLVVSEECAAAAPGRPSSVAHDSFRRYLRAWRDLATGGVEVHRATKAHATMFSGGNVEEIGRLVARLLGDGSDGSGRR